MKIFITGCGGFVGGSIGSFAASAGHEVLGVSRSKQVYWNRSCQHIQADVLNCDLAPIIQRFQPDLLVHAAGSASVAASFAEPAGDFHASIVTFANVLDGVRRSGCAPVVIFPSSAAVYGNPVILPIAENVHPEPISPYGFHKLACEILAQEYVRCFGLSIVICRLFSLFGARQRRLLVAELFDQFDGPTETVEIRGLGSETRDFLHIDDFARASLLLAKCAPQRSCTVVNIASGRETVIRELAEIMRSLIAPEKTIVCRGLTRPGDPHHWCADTHHLHALLGDWQPQDLLNALRETIGGWREGKLKIGEN